jgi:hypothetical protein
LFAFFVQNAQVVPDLVQFWAQSGCFDDGLERLSEVVLLIEQDCQRSPVDCIVGRFHSRLLETIECFPVLLHHEVTARLYIKVVGIVSGSHVGLADIFHRFDDVSLLEVAPGNVLVDAVVLFIVS